MVQYSALVVDIGEDGRTNDQKETHSTVVFRNDFSLHEGNQALVHSRLVQVRGLHKRDDCPQHRNLRSLRRPNGHGQTDSLLNASPGLSRNFSMTISAWRRRFGSSPRNSSGSAPRNWRRGGGRGWASCLGCRYRTRLRSPSGRCPAGGRRTRRAGRRRRGAAGPARRATLGTC